MKRQGKRLKSCDKIVHKIKYTIIIDATIIVSLIARIVYKYPLQVAELESRPLEWRSAGTGLCS